MTAATAATASTAEEPETTASTKNTASAEPGEHSEPTTEPETAEHETAKAETTEPETAEAEAQVEPAEPTADAPEPGWLRANALAVLLLAVTVALGGLGGWWFVEASAARSAPAAQNRALVDTGATAEVSASVTSSLNRIFSYSYDKPEVTEQAAAQVLRGPALDAYNRLFAQVREVAPQQKLVLTTRVVHSAVQSLTGDRAQLLVFLDQSATRADNNATNAGAAQLSVTAEREGDRWLIIDLTPR